MFVRKKKHMELEMTEEEHKRWHREHEEITLGDLSARCQRLNLISSCSSFGITFSAVYWSASVRFERNFTFLATLSTNCLMHLSGFSIRHGELHLLIIVNEELAFFMNSNSRVFNQVTRCLI